MKNAIDTGCQYTDVDENEITSQIIEALTDAGLEESVEEIVEGVDDAISAIVDEIYDTPEERQEAKDTAWEVIPIVAGSLIVVTIIASTICCVQGCCCECFYRKCKACQKYQKPKHNLEAEMVINTTDAANYTSMQRDSDKKFVEEKSGPEIGRPSMLNFDIAGDPTRDVTDIEASTKKLDSPTELKPTPQRRGHSNSNSMDFIDPAT